MINFGDFPRLIIFVGLCALHGGEAERIDNDVTGEIDPMPIPGEKFLEQVEAFENVKRSLVDDSSDDNDEAFSPRAYSARYLPQEFFQKRDECNIDEIRKMQRKCQCHIPKKKCVRIDTPHGTVLSTMPECVFVDRCEGLCPFSANCVPQETKPVDVQIMITNLVPDDKNSLKISYECKTIQVEKHLKCGCACQLSEKDCSPKQVFNRHQCQCQCPNLNDADECKKLNKEWNSLTCECLCPSSIAQDCSTGAFFHKTECKCVPAKTERAWRRGSRNSRK